MNTNLLALLSTLLVTNVTETVTRWERSEWVSDLPRLYSSSDLYIPGINAGHFQQSGPLEKLVTTTISRVTKLSYEWPAGVPRILETSEVLTNFYRVWKLEKTEVWREQALVGDGSTNTIFLTGPITNTLILFQGGTNVVLSPVKP